MAETNYIALSKTLSIGAIGGYSAQFFGFPAPFLMGPAILVTVACLVGMRLEVSTILRDVCFIFIGLSMGSSATPAVIDAAKQWPISFIILAITLYLIMFFGTLMLRRLFKFRPISAILASTPGHLSFVIALSEDMKADTQKIALVQSVRVLFLTLLIPFILIGLDLKLPKLDIIVQSTPLEWIALLTLTSALVGYIFKKLKLPAAYLIAGMLLSTGTHVTEMVEGLMPQWVIIPAFITMGSLIGTRFNDIKLTTLKSILKPSIAYSIVSFLLATFGALTVYLIVDLPFAQILIAFAPGGVEAMIAMSLLLNIDPTFVAAHHIMRLFVLIALIPLFTIRLKDKRPD